VLVEITGSGQEGQRVQWRGRPLIRSDHGISLEKKFLHSFKEHVRGFHLSVEISSFLLKLMG
jgi:hypothetical protein